MAAGVREVAALPDPLGRSLAVTELDEGLTLYKESCPIGVVGIIFEARPEIVPQIAALALKSGNSVILKGGTEAITKQSGALFDLEGGAPAISRDSFGSDQPALHARRCQRNALACRRYRFDHSAGLA